MSTSTSALNAQLQRVVAQFEDARRSGGALVHDLQPEQFNWRPGPERWSIGQCIAHLNISARDGVPFLDAMLQRAPALAGKLQGPYKRSLIGRIFVWVIEPPYRTRVKTQPAHVPAAQLEMAGEMELFRQNQDGYIARVCAADGRDIDGVKENLNLLAGRAKGPPANLTLYEWFLFIAAHQRRHLWQATQVRNNPAFPAR